MINLKKLSDKIGVAGVQGSSTKPGKLYHDIPFGFFDTHRKGTKLRASLINGHYPVCGKYGLDLGCSVGGISFYLQQAGASMIGVDYDDDVINFAKAVAEKYSCPVNFINGKITADSIDLLGYFDFVIWFDNFMWIEKQYGIEYAEKVLSILSKKTPVLFFSTSQNDGKAKGSIKTAKDVENLLYKCTKYETIKNIGTVDDNWHKRSIFHCYG